MNFYFSMLLIFLNVTINAQDKSTLTIDFKLNKYKEGKLYVAVYNSEDTFLKKPLVGTITSVENGAARAIFKGLISGEYAVSSFFDKNNNGKLDTNFLGIPKEPTAMSNDAKGRFGPPKFRDAKFELNKVNNIQINFKK